MTSRVPAAVIDQSPKTCPRCGRPAWFRYVNEAEADRQSPICWGELETDCPGWGRVVDGVDGVR